MNTNYSRVSYLKNVTKAITQNSYRYNSYILLKDIETELLF